MSQVSKVLSFCFIFSLFFLGCKKQFLEEKSNKNDLYESFFEVNEPVDPLIEEVIEKLRNTRNYLRISDIAKKEGKPDWADVIVKRSGGEFISSTSNPTGINAVSTILFIPLLKDTSINKFVNALLIAQKKGDTISFRLIKRGEYKNIGFSDYPNAPSRENIISIYLNLEKAVFGHRSFQLTDADAFKTIQEELVEKGADIEKPIYLTFDNLAPTLTETRSEFIEIEICQVYWVPGGQVTGSGSYELVSNTICNSTTIWVPDASGSSGPNSGAWGEGITFIEGSTGGGGSNSPPGDACLDCDNGYNPVPINPRLQTLTNVLFLTPEEEDWLATDLQLVDEFYNLIYENQFGFESLQATKATLKVLRAGLLNLPTGDVHFNLIKEYIPNSSNISTSYPFTIWLTIKCIVIRAEHPDWSTARVYWEAMKDLIHNGLDLVGLVPAFGEVADLVNGIIYTIEGDGVNASLSYGAAIPFAGWGATTAKWAKKLINISGGATTTLIWVRKAGNIIDFGDRSQLRKVLNLAVGNPFVAHHIIPWAMREHALIQKAAQGSNAFHMNEILNGIPISTFQHNNGHLGYITKVQAKLDLLWQTNGSSTMATATARQLVDNFMTSLRTLIQNNPNTKLDELIF